MVPKAKAKEYGETVCMKKEGAKIWRFQYKLRLAKG